MKITVAVSRVSARKGMSSEDLSVENYVLGQQQWHQNDEPLAQFFSDCFRFLIIV